MSFELQVNIYSMLGLEYKKRDKPMDIVQVKDFSAVVGYTEAILEMDEWVSTRPYFYIIKDHYLVDQAIRLEYFIIQ